MPKLNGETWAKNKDAIVAVAFRLFADRGYSRVSVNDVLREAGISKGCFYTYFKTKQDLFFAIVEGSDASKASLGGGLRPDLRPEERVAAYIRARLATFLRPAGRSWVRFSQEFWSTADPTEDLRALAARRYRAFAEDVAGLVRHGMELGRFRPDLDVEAFSYALLSLIDGMAGMASVMMRPLDEAKIDAAVAIALCYLRKE